MSEFVQILSAIGGLIGLGVSSVIGVKVYLGGKEERRRAVVTQRQEADAAAAAQRREAEAEANAASDARDERMLERLAREVNELRDEIAELWRVVNGYRRREFLWQNVRHGDVLMIRDLGGTPAPLPSELLALPELNARTQPEPTEREAGRP